MEINAHIILMIVPLNSLPQKKLSLLLSSTSYPPMYISVEGFYFNNSIKTYEYLIEIGISNGSNVVINYFYKRFRALYKFASLVKKDVNSFEPGLKFPQKKLIGKNDPGFVTERSQDLQFYFESMIRIPGICNSTAFKSTF